MTHTHCIDCRFYNNVTQNCDFDKYKQYKKRGIEIDNLQSLESPPVLKNFICPFKRTPEHKLPHSVVNAKTSEEIEEALIKDNGFPYAVFIYEQNDINIKEAVNQILKLDHVPKYLHITFKYMNQDEPLLKELVDMIEGHNTTIKYKLVINLDEILDHFYESYLAFRLNIMELNIPFVGIYFYNWMLHHDLTSHLSYRIQKDLLSFPYATTSKDNEFMIFPIGILEEYINIEGEHFIKKILETQCQGYRL